MILNNYKICKDFVRFKQILNIHKTRMDLARFQRFQNLTRFYNIVKNS